MSRNIHISSDMNSNIKKRIFREYKEDINHFEMERYLSSRYEMDKMNWLSHFLDMYKTIEEEDSKKPIFSQTTKFKKFPNHLKYYKYIKFSRDEEIQKKWKIQKPQTELEKISLFMKSNLNKISEENFETVQNEFMEELITYDHPELFQILSKEIYDKSISEPIYRRHYMQLCHRIWMSQEIHTNRYEIIDLEGDFYIHFKYPQHDYGLERVNSDGMLGPFTSEVECHHEAYKLMNFKRYFVHYLEMKFQNKDVTFGKCNLEDDEFFEKKKQILGLVEILWLLYQERYIHMDILHIMILNFFHINNDNFEPVEEIEIECIYVFIKKMYENNAIQKVKYPIFLNYIRILESYLTIENITKRMEFFISEMIEMIEHPENYLLQNQTEIMTEKDFQNIWKKHLRNQSYRLFEDFVKENISKYENILSIYEQMIIYMCDLKGNFKDHYFTSLNKIMTTQQIELCIHNILNKLDDYSMDNSEISQKMNMIIQHYSQLSEYEYFSDRIQQYIVAHQLSDNEDDDNDVEFSRF